MSLTLRESLVTSALPRLEAQLLWQRVLGVPRAWLIAHDTDPLDPAQVAAYRALEARRLAGEPIAYILGYREFFGRNFQVTPAVLIPRPDTELLVECGLRAIRDVRAPRVLDLGTGSGIVAVTLALERPDAQVRATDCSAQALDVARKNAGALGAKLWFSHGNWYDTDLGSGQFDLIVSNPPYIDARDGHLGRGDLRFEPLGALTDGADGLRDLRAIVRGAPDHLAPGGILCVEHGWDQAESVRSLLLDRRFDAVSSERDLSGIERVTQGRAPA
ncbi:MAG: peptide chain release factor N(5)-glutamine methyltransferase [Castellaniella sp.]|uniref:peptide chain release factor N(5)-glutamine methyltransferase n=1 Tax=Castellaniella sp. TaxID=1955812 RepID=UPI002A365F9D|nr:peptide chain release factor N(5)-glutamine methyltransferase [Castellaniella sp.]MDY0308291.1 peptide chain release factor N(5)-glutamine methyltransferase [Castellaniella sp.]